MSITEKPGRWIAQALILLVFLLNTQCAVLFVLFPEQYSGNFELNGEPGAAAVRAFGILFLMWNVPYAFAAWNPVHNLISLHQAVIMQAIGLLGESFIYYTLTSGNSGSIQHPVAAASVMRFIIFDAGGLLALLAAEIFVSRQVSHRA